MDGSESLFSSTYKRCCQILRVFRVINVCNSVFSVECLTLYEQAPMLHGSTPLGIFCKHIT